MASKKAKKITSARSAANKSKKSPGLLKKARRAVGAVVTRALSGAATGAFEGAVEAGHQQTGLKKPISGKTDPKAKKAMPAAMKAAPKKTAAKKSKKR